MNTSYEINSTPKNIHDINYLEALMDFSTPRSNVSTGRNRNSTMKNFDESQRKPSTEHQDISSEMNETLMNVHDDNETTTDQLLEKFRQHESHFRSTQTSLQLLDEHLCELSTVLHRLQASLNQNSPLRTTTDQLESRLRQMSSKREQALRAINQWNHSPIISQTLNDIIQQISPNTPKLNTADLSLVYPELVKAVQAHLNQKLHLIEHCQHTRNRVQHSHSKIQERQARLGQLIEKLLDQQSGSEAFLKTAHVDKPYFEHYAEQVVEFEKLTEEYRRLHEENRSLKHQAKENIKTLYHSINQVA